MDFFCRQNEVARFWDPKNFTSTSKGRQRKASSGYNLGPAIDGKKTQKSAVITWMVKLGIFENFDVITWDVKKHHFPQDVFFSSKKSSIFGWQKTISKTGAFVLALEVRVKLNCISRWLLFNLYLYSHVNYPNVGNWLLRTTPTNRCDPLPGPLSKENGHPLLSTTQLKKKTEGFIPRQLKVERASRHVVRPEIIVFLRGDVLIDILEGVEWGKQP